MSLHQANITIASNGRIGMPTALRAQLGLHGGETLVARIVDGSLRLEPLDAAVRRAQAMVRQYLPVGSGLVDELIAERRAAAERE